MFMRDDLVTDQLQPAFSASELEADRRMLAAEIGERRAGPVEAQRAADFIASRLAKAGLTHVQVEPFPCASLRAATTEVHERNGGAWRSVDARALVGAPSTPRGRPVTGELVWLELPENAARIQPRAFRDRIVAVVRPLPTSAAAHRRLVAAEPLAVIHVDDRLPFTWTKNDGVYPYWARAHGMPPTLIVPYVEGWRWRREGVRELRVRVDVDLVDAQDRKSVV